MTLRSRSNGWLLCALLTAHFQSLSAQGPWAVIREKLSVFAAQSKCQSWGGHLVYLNSRIELENVHNLVEKFDPICFPFWIGAHYNNKTRDFQWYDGKPLTFANWRDGEPNNRNGQEFFVEMARDKSWNDKAALKSLPLVCKRKKPADCYYGVGKSYAGPSSFSRAGTECLKWNVVNWNVYRWDDNYCRNPDGHKNGPWCFTSMNNKNPSVCNVTKCDPDYKFKDSKLPIDRAEAWCQGQGSHLSSVMTATENSNIWRQVKKLGSDFVWLGGMYDKGEGVWRWTDGEAFTFKYWSIVDKKKNSANPEPYLVMSAGTGIWHQVSKFNLLSSVCENIGFRLSLSEIPFLGRADIYHKGVWTPVCNEDWNISIARMACRERGFSDVIETFRSREQDSTSSALVLDTKQCSGEEWSIISCASYSQGADECRPLWVICRESLNVDVSGSRLAAPGDEIRLECAFTGKKYLGWFDKYGRTIPETGRVSVKTSVDGNEKKYFLHIQNIQAEDGGIYFCKRDKTVKQFKIYMKFTVGNLPKTQYIAQDKTSKLVCDIQGYPRSEISWLKAGKQVKGSRFKQDFFGSLRINNATKEDLGRYTCSVMQKVPSRTNSNTEDLFETFAIEVKMSVPPVMKRSPDSKVVVSSDSNVTLVCEALGKPRPQYNWLTSSGRELTRSRFVIDEGILTISFIRKEDLGSYLCRAQNIAGETSAAFELVYAEESSPIGYIVAGCVSGAIICIVVFIMVIRYRRLRSTTPCEIPRSKSRARSSEFEFQPNLLSPRQPQSLRYALPPGFNSVHNSLRSLQDLFSPGVELEPLEYHRDCIHIERQIGKGAFGEVSRAVLIDIFEGKIEKQIVAVKSIRGAPDEFNKELDLRKTLVSEPHPHIVNLLGYVKKSQPMLMILEYVPFGDLLGYLRQSRGLPDQYYSRDEEHDAGGVGPHQLSSLELLSFARQIANGMSFLAKKKVIHRDLAARNILVGENQICKITDFGLAQMALEQDGYTTRSRGRLPIKWSAPEVIFADSSHRVTTKSDVWSFGVVLYEIFTVGGTPYVGWDAVKVIENLRLQYRMERPEHVGEHLYNIMLDCWREHPDRRPSFDELDENISQMVEEEHYLDLDMNQYDSRLYNEVEDLPSGQRKFADEPMNEGFL